MFEEMRPHLIELRERLFKIIASVFVGFVIAFTFHNPILSWITKPLNNALVEVGKIVESRNSSTWKLKDENISTPETSSIKELQKSATRASKNMQESLLKASKIADKNLSRLLKEASVSAGEITKSIDKLITLIEKEENLTRVNTKELLKEKSYSGMITTHQVGGAFFVALKVSFFAGLILAMPFILWQLWLFIAPGLLENEKEMVKPFVIGGSVMFMVGVLFAYYVVTPFGFQFLITFGSFLYTPLINIEDYVGFFTKIMIGFGIAFELPVFSFFLAKLGLITDKSLKDFFKYAVVIIFVVAALLTPPDVLTQLLMAGPLVLLYGLSIYIVSIVNPYEGEDD